MIKRLVASCLCVGFLVPSVQAETPAPAAAVAPATAASVRSGIDMSMIDTAVRPQVDLFRYVNGRWLETTKIPAEKIADAMTQ